MEERRPRLTPAIADIRRAVRDALAPLLPGSERRSFGTDPENDGAAVRTARETPSFGPGHPAPDVLVALSGGADSLALAAATAFEAPRLGIRAGAVIVDHGLQEGSDAVSERAAGQARALGLDPVLVTRVEVAGGPASVTGGAEAAARSARYAAIDAALQATGARAVLLGHTLDDQAETVLLGLARGAGAASLAGMAPLSAPHDADLRDADLYNTDLHNTDSHDTDSHDTNSHGTDSHPAAAHAPRAALRPRDPHERDAHTLAPGTRIRPLLGIRRAQTEQFCDDSGLDPWHDPHNVSPAFTRVRVRSIVLPLLERELGPGIAEALARTAEQLREDDETLHDMATETIEDLVEHAEAGIAISAGALAANPAALRNRIIRYVVDSEFGVSLSRAQTLAVASLVTEWHGQKGVDLPGIRVVRQGSLVVFSRADRRGSEPIDDIEVRDVREEHDEHGERAEHDESR